MIQDVPGGSQMQSQASLKARRRPHRHRRGGGNVTTEAEMVVMYPQVWKCQQPQESRRGNEELVPSVWREYGSADGLILEELVLESSVCSL